MADGIDPDAARLLTGGGGPDAAGQVAAVNEQSGAGLTLVGVAEHGDSGGAVYVRWPDGRDGVLTRSPASRNGCGRRPRSWPRPGPPACRCRGTT